MSNSTTKRDLRVLVKPWFGCERSTPNKLLRATNGLPAGPNVNRPPAHLNLTAIAPPNSQDKATRSCPKTFKHLLLVFVITASLIACTYFHTHLEHSLAIAVETGDVKTVQKLLHVGVSPNAHRPRRWSLVLRAHTGDLAEADYPKILKSPVIVLAAETANRKIMKLLLENGALVDAEDIRGKTALMSAAASGSMPCVQLALDYGANINARTITGATSLRIAIQQNNPNVVALLLRKGANANQGDDDGYTALMEAGQLSSPAPIKMLLMHGANVNARDKWGRTPLLHALFSGRPTPDAVVLLLKWGADVHAVDHDNVSVSKYLTSRNPDKRVEVLLRESLTHGKSDG